MKEWKCGIRDGIPIALGYVSVSFTFGLMAVQAGLSWWQAVLISLLNVTSAGQFMGLDIMVAGGLCRNGIGTACHQFALCVNVHFAIPKSGQQF